MSYVLKSLLPDERVIYVATLHSIIYWSGLGMTILGGVTAMYGPAFFQNLLGPDWAEPAHWILTIVTGVVVVCGIFMLMGAYVRQTTTELAITNHRIIAKYGFISRSTFEIMLNRVTGSNFDQTVGGRLLGYGTVIVHGAGGDISPFDMVSNPEKFHKALVGVLEHIQPQAV
jgi:uncharacterized membrane protein YdbT with pleckstrin-like domain